MHSQIPTSPRILVHPWEPRKIPYEVTHQDLENMIAKIHSQLKQYVVLGWTKRTKHKNVSTTPITKSGTTIHFVIATGHSRIEAKNTFKYSSLDGADIWEVHN